jgi:thiol:disulfide interchange protein DsbD
VALYMVSPFIPVWAQMLGWAALFIGTGIFLRAVDPLPPDAHGFLRAGKVMGIIALVAGIAYLVGALAGSRDVLRPLSGLRASSSGSQLHETPFEKVASLADLDARVRAAAGRPVMLDFYADWCVSCKEMERFTFTDERVKARFKDMVLLQADVTANTPEHAQLLKRFRLFGPPGIVFFDREGREIQGLRVIGFQSAERFVTALDHAIAFR